jgi:hypothetical protein
MPEATNGKSNTKMFVIIGGVVVLIIIIVVVWMMMSSSSTTSGSTPSTSGSSSTPSTSGSSSTPSTSGSSTPSASGSISSTGGGLPAVVTPLVPVAPAARTYTFFQGIDSNGGDIEQDGADANNVSALQAKCNSYSNPPCLGFNTNGWMKKVLLPQAQWSNYRWTTDPSKGFYLANQ